jgi:hypothetical protein
VSESPLEQLLADHARPIFRLLPEPGQEAAVADLVGRLRAVPWCSDVAAGLGGELRVTVRDAAVATDRILPLVVSADVRLATFERARPTLEEVFLELIGPARPDDLDGRGFVRPREVGS